MSKLFRSLLWSGLVVAGVAACGDDVTVNAPGVRSISVAPDGVTIQVGQTLQMTASVNADAGIATTVTWATSDASKATVSATGLVTAVAAGSVAIQACSTVNPAVCGAATVNIGAIVPATISIDGFTYVPCFGCPEVSVPLNNVTGQIQVHLSLDAGTQKVSSVDVLVDGNVAGSQTFSLAQWQELVAKAQAAAAAAAPGEEGSTAAFVVPITISINTAIFNPTTGVPSFFNGARQVSARANLVGSAPKATPSISLTFNNASGFVLSLTTSNTPDPNSATDPRTGFQWLGGSVTFSVIGVSYVQGVTLTSASFTLFGKNVVVPLTANLGTLTLSEGTTWTSGNTGVGNYLSLQTGEPIPVGTAVLSNGQGLPAGNAILNATTPPAGAPTIAALPIIRLDNTAPSATSANGIVQGAITVAAITQVWVNATTSFAAGQLGVPSLTTLNALTSGADPEEGVDAITVQFFATAFGGSLSGASGSCTVTGLTAITTGSQLAETTVSAAFRIRVVFKDALGNAFCADLAPGGIVGGQLGADFTPPTGTVAGPAAGPPGLNVDPGNFSVTASDNASGFLATPLLVLMSRLNVGGTTTCVIGSGTGCTTPAAQALTFDATGGPNVEGYYTTSITLVDQAGNQTVLVTARLYEYDVTAPGFSGGISLPSLIAGATTNTFVATATDNLDLNTILGDVTYPTAVLRYPSQTIGAWGPPLETSVAVNYAVANWIRCINNAGDFATTTNQPSSITLTVSDQALNTTSLASAPFGANAQACGAVGNTTINFFNHNAPNYGTGKTQVDIDGASLAAASSTTVTLTAVADVPLNTSVDPFARVDFYYLSGGVFIKIGTGTVVLAQTITNRTYTYTFVWDPDAAVPVGVVPVVAIGVDAQGDAVFGSGAQSVTTVP